MKMIKRTKLMAVLLTGTLLGLGSLSANAAAVGTTAGKTISNSATVDYKVGTVSQTTITSSPDGLTPAGKSTDFVVDAKLLVTVVQTDAALVDTQPNSTTATTHFTVTNNSNQAQDAILTPASMASGTADPFGGSTTSSLVMPSTSFKMYIDVDNSGTFTTGDTDITATGVIGSMASGQVDKVIVVTTIPSTAANGKVGVISLVAKVGTAGSGAALTSDDHATAWTSGTRSALKIFADLLSTTPHATGDVALDGQTSALSGYLIKSSALTVAKTAKVLTDPANCTTAGVPSSCPVAAALHSIPGAVMQYTIAVKNTATATGVPATDAQLTASSIILSDDLSSMTTFLDDTGTSTSMTLTYGPIATPTTVANCTSGATPPCTFASDKAIANVASIAPGETATLTFNVTIK